MFTKATEKQKAEYAGLYPLYGYVTNKVNGVTVVCAIEDLRGSWSRPDPVWECRFPEGYSESGCHGLLEHTLKDAIAAAGFCRPCDDYCSCKS